MIGEAQAVLGSAATALVGMENTSSSGHATNRGGVAVICGLLSSSLFNIH